ncbi:MAG: hypothetical protein CVV07_06915 [Gammaproteobacteria bacterium HGW-Gammaproteobacteria-11]|nr:MAG: hypothetical protein CVV07_06915 [Gammaproteobacteria bacterium HGW-Gammaproteobacteria-11]
MSTYKGYPINTGKNNQYEMIPKILEETYLRFEYMTQKLKQCFLVRFDLHLPVTNTYQCPLDENRLVSEFFNRLIHKKLKPRCNRKPSTRKQISPAPRPKQLGIHKHIQYLWVREVEKSKRAHYHCWILVDRHKMATAGSHLRRTGFYGIACDLWNQVSKGGHLQGVKDNKAKYGLSIRNKLERDSAFYAISYLAKKRGKGYRKGTSVRDYGGSKTP